MHFYPFSNPFFYSPHWSPGSNGRESLCNLSKTSNANEKAFILSQALWFTAVTLCQLFLMQLRYKDKIRPHRAVNPASANTPLLDCNEKSSSILILWNNPYWCSSYGTFFSFRIGKKVSFRMSITTKGDLESGLKTKLWCIF